jgi:hypothetical protein
MSFFKDRVYGGGKGAGAGAGARKTIREQYIEELMKQTPGCSFMSESEKRAFAEEQSRKLDKERAEREERERIARGGKPRYEPSMETYLKHYESNNMYR